MTTTLRKKNLCQLIGISRRTLHRLHTAGNGPPFTRKHARLIVYALDDVLAWIDARQRRTTEAP